MPDSLQNRQALSRCHPASSMSFSSAELMEKFKSYGSGDERWSIHIVSLSSVDDSGYMFFLGRHKATE